MTSVVRHLLRDHVRRTWGYWLFGCLAYVDAASAFIDNPHSNGVWRGLLYVGLLPLVAVSSNRQIRYLPSIADFSLLPVSRDDMGRLLWWICIGAPGLIISAINLVMLIGAATLGYFDQSLFGAAIWLLMPWALLGLQLLAPPFSRIDSALLRVFGTTPALMMVAARIQHIDRIWAIGVVVVVWGIGAAIFLFSHPERLRSRMHQETSNNTHVTKTHKNASARPPYLRGWTMLVATHFLHPMIWIPLLLFAVTLMLYRELMAINEYVFGVAICAIPQIFIAPNRRLLAISQQLRLLPVTNRMAAAVTYTLTIAPTLAIYAGAIAILTEAQLHFAWIYAMYGFTALLFLPSSIWFEFVDSIFAKIAWIVGGLIGFAIFIVAMSMAVPISRSSLVLSIFVVVTISAGYELTRRALAKAGRETSRHRRNDSPSVS